MNEPLNLTLALVVGVGLGMVFFGGLWWTVAKALSSRTPALWFPCSLLLRTGITLAGFYYVGQGQWENLAACLLGFVAGRALVTWLTRPPAATPTPTAKEVGNAH